MTFNAQPGDYLQNGAYLEMWTCPNCYHDHRVRVDRCESCSIPLECTIEMQPVPVCTVIDPAIRSSEEDDDE